jgi:hypothetical protein
VRTYWLIWARNLRTGEEKYFVSNASRRSSLRRLLRVAFTRWNVEHSFRLSKGEIGFRHFEGRSYVALMRHLVLCCVTLTFVADQAERLRGKNPDVTMEQVCVALNLVCVGWLEQLRETDRLQYTSELLEYRQRRNRMSRESRQRRQRGLPAECMRSAARATRRRRARNQR